MKVLFVSTSIPPATDMHTTRNMYVIEAFLKAGHNVDVLTCGDYQSKNTLFDGILNKIKVYRTEYPLIMRWHNYMLKNCKIGIIKKIHNVAINYYAIPDLYANWENLAVKMIKNYKLFDYDVIVTTSGSYTAHFVGRKWKEITGKAWVADYGDPWGVDAYGNIKPLYYKLEQPILNHCDGLIFTTNSTINVYKEKYKTHADYELVTCGFGETIKDIESNNIGKQFTYMGIAYKRGRNLSLVLDAISCRKDASAMLVGTIGDDIRELYKAYDNIICKGRVPYEVSLEIMAKSDVMVIVGNFGTMQIPGKTYIYLSSQKPILYVQQQEKDDPTLELIKQFPGVVCCRNTADEIREAIDYIIKNYNQLKDSSSARVHTEMLLQYRWEEQGKKFVTFVENKVKKIRI